MFILSIWFWKGIGNAKKVLPHTERDQLPRSFPFSPLNSKHGGSTSAARQSGPLFTSFGSRRQLMGDRSIVSAVIGMTLAIGSLAVPSMCILCVSPVRFPPTDHAVFSFYSFPPQDYFVPTIFDIFFFFLSFFFCVFVRNAVEEAGLIQAEGEKKREEAKDINYKLCVCVSRHEETLRSHRHSVACPIEMSWQGPKGFLSF